MPHALTIGDVSEVIEAARRLIREIDRRGVIEGQPEGVRAARADLDRAVSWLASGLLIPYREEKQNV